MALPWISAWDHPLHTPDEGRYGTVSADMSAHDDWIVPHFRGAPHLTKPPLIYWLQAGAINLLGRTEFAIRLPSLIAGSLACLVVFLFVRRMRGREMATIAVGLYGAMPLPLAFARMGTIDSLLNFLWIAALACAALAIDAKRRRARGALGWLALAWVAVALAALAKGPIAPAPMVIIGAWLLLARRWRELAWFVLHGFWGAALALLPIGAWVVLIAQRYPEAWEIWRQQFIDRFASGLPAQPLTGLSTNAHVVVDVEGQPFWFYAPLFLAGMMPATCALTLPWFNMRLREALRAFSLGDLRALMLMAALAPLLFFSVAKGKMPAYIVPVAAPTAFLVAGMLARAVGARRGIAIERSGTRAMADEPLTDAPLTISKEPEVRLTFALVTIFGLIGGAVAGGILGGASGAMELIAFIPVPLLACAAAWRWRRGEHGRRTALLMQWSAMVLVALLLIRLEHRTLIGRDMGARAMIESIQRATGSARPQIVVYTFRNPTIDFYADGDPLMIWSVSDLHGLWPKLRPDHAVLIPERIWRWIEREYPHLASSLAPLGREADGDADERLEAIWNRWPGKPTVVLRMLHAPEAEALRDESLVSPEPRE